MFKQTGNRRRLVAGLAMFALGFATAALTFADEPVTPIFVEPPSAQTLADILFPRRYRGVDSQDEERPDAAFGMMIHFDLDSAAIRPQSLPLLESIGEMLRLERLKNKVVVIEGHTDARGTDEHNDTLSEMRADAIKRYLVQSFDIAPSRLITAAFGESRLHDAADPLNEINRRVVFRATQSISVE